MKIGLMFALRPLSPPSRGNRTPAFGALIHKSSTEIPQTITQYDISGNTSKYLGKNA